MLKALCEVQFQVCRAQSCWCRVVHGWGEEVVLDALRGRHIIIPIGLLCWQRLYKMGNVCSSALRPHLLWILSSCYTSHDTLLLTLRKWIRNICDEKRKSLTPSALNRSPEYCESLVRGQQLSWFLCYLSTQGVIPLVPNYLLVGKRKKMKIYEKS